METLENTNGAVTRTDLRWRGDMHPCPLWLRPCARYLPYRLRRHTITPFSWSTALAWKLLYSV